MSNLNRSRAIVFLVIVGLIVVMLPLSVQARTSPPIKTSAQTVPDGLDGAVKAALRSNYRPMQFPSTQQAKLLASDKSDNDYFGNAVSISGDGNTVVVGAGNESDSGTSQNGATYIFTRMGGNWTEHTKLLAFDKENETRFGDSVSISNNGDTILVGAVGRNNNGVQNTRTAYVYNRIGDVWTYQSKLIADVVSQASYGIAVSLSGDGNTALVGAGNDGIFPNANGSVFVFRRVQGFWIQSTKLLASDGANYDNFGRSVSLSFDGGTALIGADGTSDGSTLMNGAAYVFTRSGEIWTQQAKLFASDKESNSQFGWKVSISGDGYNLLIGANRKSDNGTSFNGAAYSFVRVGDVWTQQAKLLANDKADFEHFGFSVSLSFDGNTALVGARGIINDQTLKEGSAYTFTRNGELWTQQAKLLASDRVIDDGFGISVVLNATGSTALIGAFGTSDNGTTHNGAAYIFTGELFTPTVTPAPPLVDTIGVYKNGVFFLRNSNTNGLADITTLFGGDPSDLPVAGDWNGDGVDTIGVYRGATGVYFLSDSNTVPSVTFNPVFGNPGDTPFAGKWTADMTHDGIGVYRNSNGILYQKKTLITGFSDFFAVFGNPGDQGVAGDWDGNGFDSIGIYRASNQNWFLSNNSQPSGITFSDMAFTWDMGANLPVVGDWDGNGTSTVGSLAANGVFTLHATNATIGVDNIFAFGGTGSKPIAGKWFAASRPPSANGIISAGGLMNGVIEGGSGE